MWCLRCGSITPTNSDGPVYCSGCSRGLGAKICPNGHKNGMAARYCSICRSADLSEATPYIPAGYVTRPIAWLIVLILVGWVCHHMGFVLGALWTVAAWLLFHVAGVPLCGVFIVTIRLGALAIILYAISQLAPKSAAGQIAGLVLRVIVTLTKLTGYAVAAVGRALYRMAEGRRSEPKKPKKKQA